MFERVSLSDLRRRLGRLWRRVQPASQPDPLAGGPTGSRYDEMDSPFALTVADVQQLSLPEQLEHPGLDLSEPEVREAAIRAGRDRVEAAINNGALTDQQAVWARDELGLDPSKWATASPTRDTTVRADGGQASADGTGGDT